MISNLRFRLRLWWRKMLLKWKRSEMPALPAALPPIMPPDGFDDWFVWECVQFTKYPFAFWLDPRRYDEEPTPDQRRKAQDAVASLYGLRVEHEVGLTSATAAYLAGRCDAAYHGVEIGAVGGAYPIGLGLRNEVFYSARGEHICEGKPVHDTTL